MPAAAHTATNRSQERIRLAAGPLTMELEPDSGFLRYVRLGDREVLRCIYVAVRDRNWGTVPPELSDLKIECGDGAFHVTFAVECRQAEIDFPWRGEITGTADGTVDYRMEGIARSTFLRNRIGFCVLHPSDACAGAACTIEHVDGSSQQTAFPHDISPGQPFVDVRAISHQVLPGLIARVLMQGDTFETEDERNWTDASFKTYCTPIGLPFPTEITEGTRIQQSVQVQLVHQAERIDVRPASDPRDDAPIPIRFGAPCRLPRIGLGMASHGRPLSSQAQSRLSALRLDHLRLDLALGCGEFGHELKMAAKQARQLGTALHVALALDDHSENSLHRLAADVRRMSPPITAWLVHGQGPASASPAMLQMAREALSCITPDAAFALGTNANFAELNRGRPPRGLADWICYAINPQVHVFDDDSLIDTLEAQADTVTSAQRFAGDSLIAVSPVTLKPRFNAVATGPETPPLAGKLPPQVDPRQATLFTAGWTLGSLISLACGGADFVTYFETTGWRGVIELDEGCELPDQFPSTPRCVFPVYHLLADVAEVASSEVRPVISDAQSRVHGFVAFGREDVSLWLANLSRQIRTIELPEDMRKSGSWRMRVLDEDNLTEAMTSPQTFRQKQATALMADMLTLPSRALVRLQKH